MGRWTTQNKRDAVDAAVLASLQEKVKAARSESEKYGVLKDLAQNKTPEVKTLLLESFRSLPPSSITTSPTEDAFKAKIFELTLPMLDQSERRVFVLETLDAEISNMRFAQSKNCGNMYPVALWRNIITAVDAEDNFSAYYDKFLSMAQDMTLPQQFRVDTLAKSEQYKARNTPEAKIIRDILMRLNAKPESFVPWEYFNDPVKRKAYCLEGASYANMLKRSSEWRRAGNEVKYESDLKLLKKFRLNAIEQILLLLKKNDVNTERRDALAEVAGDIFASLLNLTDAEKVQAEAFEANLRAYINAMEDKGAFCHRFYAIQGLSRYYDNVGRKWDPPPKSGWAPTDKHFASSTTVTNQQQAAQPEKR